MKLVDIFQNALCINEMYNTHFDRAAWDFTDGRFIGNALLGEDSFKLYIEPSIFHAGNHKITWLNIAFSRIVDGKEVQELTAANKNTSQVLGAVINALSEKIAELDSQYNIDALAFCVVESEKKRLVTYQRILGSKALVGLHNWNLTKKEINIGNGWALVALSRSLSKTEHDVLFAEITKHGKSLV
jgi:hypothetical protein